MLAIFKSQPPSTLIPGMNSAQSTAPVQSSSGPLNAGDTTCCFIACFVLLNITV